MGKRRARKQTRPRQTKMTVRLKRIFLASVGTMKSLSINSVYARQSWLLWNTRHFNTSFCLKQDYRWQITKHYVTQLSLADRPWRRPPSTKIKPTLKIWQSTKQCNASLKLFLNRGIRTTDRVIGKSERRFTAQSIQVCGLIILQESEQND